MTLTECRFLRLPIVALVFLLLSGPRPFAASDAGRPEAPQSTPDPVKAKRLAWFHEAKYGLFIHWGLYAIPAGEWKGRRIPGIGEWIMNRTQIPVKEYEQLAKEFNPVKFDADAWVQLARDAGMTEKRVRCQRTSWASS